MAAPNEVQQPMERPFPAQTRSVTSSVQGIPTNVNIVSFTDKIVITISQMGKLSHWIHVSLAGSAADPMNPGPLINSSENGLLPMTHLTATTILGGTKKGDEIIEQTLATTIASAILMKHSSEERLLVTGLGIRDASQSLSTRPQFEELVGLVLDVL